MGAKIIKTLSHFIAACSEIKPLEDHTLFYRGHASTDFIPLPTIFRPQNDDPKKSKYVESEEDLFHNMVTQCPEEFKSCTSTFDYLVKMQHYGLPTRLLDITSNPLVALYFACCSLIPRTVRDSSAKDAQVLIYQIPNSAIKYYNSDTVSVISNLARAKSNFDYEKNEDRERFIHTIQAEKPYFKPSIDESHLHSVVCVKPKLDNRRIIKQSGAFFLFGMGKTKTDSIRIPDTYRPKIKHIDIPKNAKEELLKELSILAISEASLFPEIDNVARFLKKEANIKPISIEDELDINIDNQEVISDEFINYVVDKLAQEDELLNQISNSKDRAKLGLYSKVLEATIINSQENFNDAVTKLLINEEAAKKFSDLIFGILQKKLEETA